MSPRVYVVPVGRAHLIDCVVSYYCIVRLLLSLKSYTSEMHAYD